MTAWTTPPIFTIDGVGEGGRGGGGKESEFVAIFSNLVVSVGEMKGLRRKLYCVSERGVGLFMWENGGYFTIEFNKLHSRFFCDTYIKIIHIVLGYCLMCDIF